MKEEIWKDIPGYEGLYQVSNKGNAKSLSREIWNGKGYYLREEKMLSNSPNPMGYNRVVLRDEDGKSYYVGVHYLVLMSFVGPKPEGYTVCHIDNDKMNNKLENLRYDSLRENSIDMYRHGYKITVGKLTVEDVVEIRRLYATGKYLQKDLANIYNVSQSNISRAIKSERFSWLNDDGTINESKTQIKL